MSDTRQRRVAKTYHSVRVYLNWDLELVQGADVFHQHSDDELMRHALRNRLTVNGAPGLEFLMFMRVTARLATFLSVNEDRTCVYMSDWSMTA